MPYNGLTRREVLKLSAAGVIIAPGVGGLLAACSDKSIDSGGGGGGDTNTGPTQMADDFTVDVDTIKVGVVAPFSGVFSWLGDVVNESLDIALGEINNQMGGFGGAKVEVVRADADVLELAQGTNRAYNELASQDDVSGIIWCTALGLDFLFTDIERDQMPIVSVFQDLQLEKKLWPNAGPQSVFQTLLPFDLALDVVGGYVADDRGYTNTLLVRDSLLTSLYEQRVIELYEETAEKFNLEALPEVTFTTGAGDPGGIVSQMEDTNCETAVIVSTPDDTALIAKELQARDMDFVGRSAIEAGEFRPQLFGTPANMGEPRWIDLAEGAAKQGCLTAWHLAGMLYLPNLPIHEMVKNNTPDVKLTGGEESPADALWAILQGIRVAGTAKDRASIWMGMENTGEIQFTTLPFEFTEENHLRVRPEEAVLVTPEYGPEASSPYTPGPADTDPPYVLGKEWEEGEAMFGYEFGPVQVVRPTVEINKEIHPETVDIILEQGYGDQAVKEPPDATGLDVEMTDNGDLF